MKIRNHRLEGNDGRLVNWIKSPNIGGQLANSGKPSTLVMHYTAGGAGSQTVSYFKTSSAGVSAHLVIDRNGDVTQMVKFNTVGWHAGKSRWKGKSGVNKFSIGIELANYGKVTRTEGGGWVSWSGNSVSNDRVIVMPHKHFPNSNYGWEIFDNAQINTAIAVAQAIVKEYDLKPWDLVGHEDISIHRKIDPGPAFDMDKFRTMVFGRSEDTWNDTVYSVESTTGLNLRTAPAIEARLIENLPNKTKVHVVEQTGNWWLVAKIINNQEDVTGYVHRNWLIPVA